MTKIASSKLKTFYTTYIISNWTAYYESNEYKKDLEKIINYWKDDIIGGFNIAFAELIYMTDEDDKDRNTMIELDNRFDGTFEYVCYCFDKDYYYPNSFPDIYYLFEERTNSFPDIEE